LEQLNIIKSDYSTEMKERYIEYAMSVIAGRALPKIEDGLKPVHLRILYSMYELGITPDKPHRKSARIVGDVLGKFHPHGDSSVYDALVRMSQDFNLRYPLVDGHGNFGSIDGDSAAAMRYTESRLSKLALEMLRDINKNTVDFRPNFDGEEQEPCMLPSRFPNLLANGSEGIAVGMATSIPSHNLKELIAGFTFLIDNPQANTEEIMKYIPCPDFATGGVITNPNNAKEIYDTGRGSITIRSKYHMESIIDDITKKPKKLIVFTEIPYQTNKTRLCIKIAELIEDKDIILKEILDVRDESDSEGMRIVIELKTTSDENKILSRLFKKTDLQKNYNAIFCVLVKNEPKIFGLKQIMEHYITHQKEVLSRRTQFDLDKCNKRLHILNGLIKAIESIDETIKLIRTSKNPKEAKEKLCNYLTIDEQQAQAILDFRLQKLTGLEVDTLKEEHNELQENIIRLQSILNNENKLLELLKTELLEIKEKFGDERRSELLYEDTIQEIKLEDMIEDYSTTIVLTKEQYIKKNLKYSEKQAVKDGDEVLQIIQTNNKKDLLLFTNQGRVYTRKIHDSIGTIECTASGLGEYIPNIIKDLNKDEKIIYIASPETYDKGYMLYIFENNSIVKMNMKPYENKQNRKVAQDAYNPTNNLKYIKYITDDIDMFITTNEGKSLILNTSQFNPLNTGGKKSLGNSFIKLDSKKFDDNGIASIILEPKADSILNVITEKKEFELKLNDLADNGKMWFEYLQGSKNNTGTFIYNCRQKNDRVIDVKLI
jgi:DNA gyrase subunit A